MRTYRVPAPLATGTVRGGHIVFLYAVIFVSTAILGGKLTRSVDPDLGFALRNIVVIGMGAMAILALTLIVPELRKSVPMLYSNANRNGISSVGDVLVFACLMITWGFGASRLLVMLPLLHWNPDLYASFGLGERAGTANSMQMTLLLVSATIIAPFAEELFFRGFMQNLFVLRWGLWPGIVLSAFFFGIAHYPLIPFAMVAGIFYSLAYVKFGNLWPGTLLHGLHNLLVSPLALNAFFQVKPRADVTSVSHWIPETLLTIAFVPLLILFWRRFRPSA